MNGEQIKRENIETISHDKNTLMEAAKRITYMNLQKEIGRRYVDKEERDELFRFYFDEKNGHNFRNQKELIDALEPDIFIITGDLGLEVMNKLYAGEINIPKHGMTSYKDILFIHLFHPSTSYFSYDYIIKKIDMICSNKKDM
jgi:hypothetical protein